MIVTRQRRKRSHLGRYLLPLAALAALGFALSWPPSQNAIANGPLRPLWLGGSKVVSVVGAPLSFAAQQQQITDRNRTIQDLNAQLEKQRAAAAAADTRAQQVQQQMAALVNQPRPAPIRAVRAASAPVAASAIAGAAPSRVPSEDDRRLAATWAAMEPDKAAAVVQRLPDDEVVRVLAAMDSESAGQIMNALPAKVAARLSQSSEAQVGSGAGR